VGDPLHAPSGTTNAFALRRELGSLAWDSIGIVRSAAALDEALERLDAIEARLADVALPGEAAGNPSLQSRMDTANLVTVARLIATSAALREESRGSHYREDFPQTSPDGLYNIHARRSADGAIVTERRPVRFTRRRPEELAGDTVIPAAASTAIVTATT
jgi:succinate dehydrogenase/fumarate reductase flavoprotein subunit